MSDIVSTVDRMLSDVLRSTRKWPPRSRSRRGRNKRQKRFLKKWVWDTMDVSKPYIDDNKEIFLAASDLGDLITSRLMSIRNEQGWETVQAEVTLLVTASEWQAYIKTLDFRRIMLRAESGLLIEDDTASYISYDINSSAVEIRIYGSEDFVDNWFTALTAKFEQVKNVIEWIYSSDGQSIDVPLRGDRIPVDEMYPFLEGETLKDYYDRFMHSEASILLLIGPPGTGKTTFIRGLLQHTEMSAIVTYDATILAKDFVFAQFIEGDRSVMIIEDADNFLGARSDGNDLMHKFLNVGDGLVTTKNKKLIFSTNLPSIKDVDSALVRPGRCFDIINFAPLTQTQAEKLATKLNISLDGVRDSWSIADVFHKQVLATKAPKRKMGFV